jgi:hypothetical protein
MKIGRDGLFCESDYDGLFCASDFYKEEDVSACFVSPIIDE